MKDNPYPGLLYFTPENSHLFFGREGQSDALVARMARSRFLAVVGTSGSGKSSLVRAGLLPSLWAGYLKRAGSDWLRADFRPGADPIGRLSAALSDCECFGDAASIATSLRQSSLALAQMVREASLGGRNLLVLVDQFEEIFRSKTGRERRRDHDENAVFVKLLLEAARTPDLPIYVVITMRSDFLGDCAAFRDLPEAISEGQYLIPRLTREQQRSAIEGPARIAGGAVSNRLVQQLLNDTAAGQDYDQLPLLQHALMRTWDAWARNPGQGPMDLDHYQSIGTISRALSLHADEALSEASKPPGGEGLAKVIFQRLADHDGEGRETKRECSIQELVDVTGAKLNEITTCLSSFRQPERAFLMPLSGKALGLSEHVEITHECLLRKWERLRNIWIPEELESSRIYGKLVDRAEDRTLLTGRALRNTVKWWNRRQPNQHWAARYKGDFGKAEQFKCRSQRWRWLKLGGMLAGAIAVVVFLAQEAHKQVATRWQQSLAEEIATVEKEKRLDAVTLMMARTAASLASDSAPADNAALLAATAYSLHRDGSEEARDVLTRVLATLPAQIRKIPATHTAKLAFAAQGKILALADTTGQVSLWNTASLRSLGSFASGGAPKQLELSSDGSRLAIATTDRVRVFRLSTDSQLSTEAELDFACDHEYWTSLSGTGDQVVSTCDGVAHLFKKGPRAWREDKVRELRDVGWVISASGKQISTMLWNKDKSQYLVWNGTKHDPESRDMPSGLQQWAMARGNLTRLAWTTDGTTIEVGSTGDKSDPLRLSAGGQVENFLLGDFAESVVATSAGGLVQFWTLPDGLEQLHHRYPSKINDVAFDSQSGLLALGFDGEVELIRLTTAQEISVSRPIVTPGGIVASTPGGTLVALRFRDDANPLLPLEILPCPYTRSVALSMDATRAAFFDCPEKKERALSVVALPGPAEAKKFEWEDQLPRRLVLSDDGRRLAAVFSEKPASAKQGQSPMGGNAESRLMMRFLWIEDGGQPVQKIKPIAIPPEMRFWEFARSGRAAWICAGENPASLQRADFDTGQWKEWPIPVGNGVTAFAVSPKESHLAVAETEEIGATATASARGGASRSVKVWDVKTKTAVTLRSRGGAGTMGTTSAMAFASDGSHLATADGATVRVWDLQGAEVARYVLPAPFAQLAFSQDGHRVVAVANRHVYVFPSDDGELLKTVCRVVGRDLTKKEWAQYVPNEPYIGVCEKDLAAAAAAR